MTEYICPNCRGGFNEGPLDDGCCPWCGQALDGSYDPPTVHSITKVESSDETEADAKSRLKRMFWPGPNDD